jgi:cobalt-zinc-cadmium efflux system outer membrane protein
MQLGPFQLLRAKEQQIETAAAYIEALRDYWLARGDLGQILSGRLPSANGMPAAQTGGKPKMADQAGH